MKCAPDLSLVAHVRALSVPHRVPVHVRYDSARKTGICRTVRTVNNAERLEDRQTVFN